jgi:hypothetical protein
LERPLYFLLAGFIVKNIPQVGLSFNVSGSMVNVSFFCWIAVRTHLYYSVHTDNTGGISLLNSSKHPHAPDEPNPFMIAAMDR